MEVNYFEDLIKEFFPDSKIWKKNAIRSQCRVGGIMYLRTVCQLMDMEQYPTTELQAQNVDKRYARDRRLASSIRWYTFDLIASIERYALKNKRQIWTSKEYKELTNKPE